MLSILIPVYNYNVISLVKELHNQVSYCSIDFEILVLDDHSDAFVKENEVINELSGCSYEILPKNIGRSAIRNLLASKASFDSLLFIDAGTFPANGGFIKNYLDTIQNEVVTGGMSALPKAPKKPYKLRWIYTKKREMVTDKQDLKRPIVCSSNFLIKKELFNHVQFDESLTKYGCEDVLFFDAISKKGIAIKYIDNPVIHDANDDAETFIIKTEHAVENLVELIATNRLTYDRYKVSKLYAMMHKIRIDQFVKFIFILFRGILKKNLKSSYPSILCYDFYRLGYFCLIKNKK
ncbi:glycosyltransferase family 2 protein [Aquimarina litoralis]|uniref:glycosyltransferase family 2 protein n=1 Tax=Aquimarina litoralis TaxID=584605 RepID=UPI001C5966B2|nr:glycosyltransferase [Aquimarina litoralis]MBW1294948.1 glycosyltransferase [Aquimarina litoralis]